MPGVAANGLLSRNLPLRQAYRFTVVQPPANHLLLRYLSRSSGGWSEPHELTRQVVRLGWPHPGGPGVRGRFFWYPLGWAGLHIYQDGPKVVDVRESRARDKDVAKGREEPVRVVVVEVASGSRFCSRAGQRHCSDNRAGVSFGPIDAVGISDQSGDAWRTVESQGEREAVFRIRAAAAAPCTVTVASPPNRMTSGAWPGPAIAGDPHCHLCMAGAESPRLALKVVTEHHWVESLRH